MDIPFKILSFPQYLAANMHKLTLGRLVAGTITLHEACKSAYTGLDSDGARKVLRQLPGMTLREMAHHGPETICCGSGASCWFPESCTQIREKRLQEAANTRAERLVTVCHHCGQAFAAEESKYDFIVTNFVNLVAEAMGIKRDDTFKVYKQWGGLDLILKDAHEHIAASPYKRDRIIEVLQEVFIK
jgi:Fe-S oxidoreductase